MKKKINSIFALLLVFSMLLGDVSSIFVRRAYALDVDGMRIDEVKYIKKHDGFNVTGGSLIILGKDLIGKDIYFDVGGEPQKLGTLAAGSGTSILNYKLSDEEVNLFTGKIYAGSTVISLVNSNMPYISGADKDSVNQDNNETLTLRGANLNKINNTTITATYGKGISMNNIANVTPAQSDFYTFIPLAPAEKGFQDILLKNIDTVSDPKVEITYHYSKAFRIVQNLNLEPIQMYPNSASRGDYITLSSDGFSSADKYRVYFLDVSDNDFAFEDYKMSKDIVLSQDQNRLSVQVPTSPQLELGSKKVVITKIANNEIIARFNLAETFNLIDAKYQPVITKINPNKGSDEGAGVQIIGRNLINPIISGLSSQNNKFSILSALPVSDNHKMKVQYDVGGISFRGEAVTELNRIISVTIAKAAKFNLKPDGSVNYSQVGADDNLFVTTGVIDEVGSDPVKDVLVEIETVIKSGGKSYVFHQSAIEPDGFTFLESSVEPKITAVYPELIQINPAKKLQERTLISIEGDNFLVNKYTDSTGVLKTNYPVVQIQTGTDLGGGEYIIKIDAGEKSGTLKGTIYNPQGEILKNQEGDPIPVDMVVLNGKGTQVDGSKNNEIGKRILVYLPKELTIQNAGRRHVQVINPKRASDEDGKSVVARDMVEFVMANDTPVISGLNPSIVTINSNTEITVKGSNFQEGIKVYIDGVEVSGVERKTDTQGSGMTLKFKAPKGRVGKTQLALLNPAGGIATRDFYFIKSLGQDPVLESIAPDKGTTDTLVIANGDNFFKPDPATETADGLDIYRLIGSRIYLDGRDVNRYNKNAIGDIELKDYVKPGVETLLKIINGRLEYTSYKDNVYVTSDGANVIYSLKKDADGNPMLFDGNRMKYAFKLKGALIYAYDEDGKEVGKVDQTVTDLQVEGGDSFKVHMDNALISVRMDANKKKQLHPADYWKAVVLYDETGYEFYTISSDLDGKIRLTNGKDKMFSFRLKSPESDNPVIQALDKSGTASEVSVTDKGLEIAALNIKLKMRTPFVIENGRITGKRSFVNTKNEIFFQVPVLDSGSGLKDVEVVNPDTKSSKLAQSFYYYHLPSTDPIISRIVPNRGSVEGAYLIRIYGRDFKDSTQVYIGGILIPPTDKYVDTDGAMMEIKVPKYPIDLNAVFGVGELTVPVVVVNSDGASAQDDRGFTYIKPASTPVIKKLILNSGSSNGGEVVEIIGEDFRFFEPYINLGGSAGYDEGVDTFTNLNNHLAIEPKWEDLLKSHRYVGVNNDIDLWEPKEFPAGLNYYGYDKYYDSAILPSVYFGTQKAYIVEFDRDYLKVISPMGKTGKVDVVVMNNDSGVSNKMAYNYESSDPVIDYINPSSGGRTGFDKRSIVGKGFNKNRIASYQNDDASVISNNAKDLDALVRFGDLTNEYVKIGEKNDGRINANHAIVNMEGGLRVSYDGSKNKLDMSLEEGGNIYKRTFSNYDGRDVLFPVGMLKNGSDYYVPFGTDYNNKRYNSENDYEFVRIRVDRNEKRLIVERGYAPKSELLSEGRIDVRTPSYYTIGDVNVYLFNPDGGRASSKYTYTNPASKPIIESAKPMDILPPNSTENDTTEEQRIVQASVKGSARVEIIARDIREDAKLYFGTKEVKIIEIVRDDSLNLQTVIAEVPEGTNAEISVKQPIIIINKDGGSAISTDKKSLGSDKRLLYFVYRKPLSLPDIKEVLPERTSQYGGNKVTVKGSDFRKNLQIILGSKGGVPVSPNEIDSFGRYVTFYVPSGLIAGKKDLQIVNADYGTVTKQAALEIISYPELNSIIRDEKGSREIDVLSTEGKQVITITGRNFMKGAKVYFGGKRSLKSEKGEGGVEGFYKDDNVYTLSSAIQATSVEFVDENTLKVTTPEIKDEKDYKITVINSDTGLSSDNVSVRFSLPRPSAITKLKVEVVDDKYIKLYDYRAPGIEYFNIYAYIGNKNAYQIRRDKYADFKALDTTSIEPFKVTRLEGFSKLKKNDYIHFAIKGSNDFGSSDWSNIATLTYKGFSKLKSFESLNDGRNIGLDSDEISRLDIESDRAKYIYNKNAYVGDIRSLIGTAKTDGIKDFDFYFPSKMINNFKASLRLDSPIAYVTLKPAHLNTPKFRKVGFYDSTYGVMHYSWAEDEYSSSIKSRLPRVLKSVSPVINFEFYSLYGSKKADIGSLNAKAIVAVKMDSPYITEKAGGVYLYRYDDIRKSWVLNNYTRNGNLLKFEVDRSAYYVLVQAR